MTDLLLIVIPLAIMGASVFVFTKGYKFAKNNDNHYTIASALETPVPAEEEAKQLILEYAEALSGRYSDDHKMNHALQWVEKLEQHVHRNRSYYKTEVAQDLPNEQLAEKDTNVIDMFANKR
ncbi:hypothetical protein [Kangiella sp. TOML190]|uniref:hypothetical protein n=1 Tax=Kangiella sp. TOML190 TaxID=2931351 RepID=UPI00203BA47B|nr:hypothetical protein [Kangiella sp. TOML190]